MTKMAKKKILLKKLPAVRLAVKELGVDASVADVTELVKEKYNLKLTDATAQTYVTTARRELREGNGAPAKVQQPKAVPTPKPAPVLAMPSTEGNDRAVGQAVDAMSTIKGLVGTLGKVNLLKLVEAI